MFPTLIDLTFVLLLLLLLLLLLFGVVVVVASMSGRRGKRQKKLDGQSELPPDRAAEGERDNPMCGKCNMFPTNHFCSFVLPSKDQCGAPVCGICKGDDSEVTRCSRHLWSNASSNNNYDSFTNKSGVMVQ